jgi:PAS domain S-box-containing protein
MPNRSARTRRGAQVEITQPAQFYRQLADSSPHMLWSARPDGAADYFNARILEYAGRSHTELEGWGWRNMVHPEDVERCLARWTKAYKRGQPYEVEYRLRRHDGKYLWHLGAAMPHREGGRIVRWFGSSIEIENQKRAEKLLEKARETLQSLVRSHAEHGPAGGADAWRRSRETEERLRSVIALSSDFFWETDAEHRLTLLEAGGQADAFAFTPVRVGKTRWEIPSVLPDAEGWRRHRETLDARRAFRDFEVARADDAGVVRHFLIHGGPFFGARGKFLGYRGVGREITERRLAERALQENERQFRAFLESMPAIAWIKDASFRYRWLSASYCRLHGRSPEEIIGRDDFEVWPKALAHSFRKGDELALRAGGPVPFSEHAPFADGSPGRWMVVKFPLPDATGAVGVAGIGFDITDGDGEIEPEQPVDVAASPLERLSARERQVMQLVVDGLTSAEVGERLGLSPKSIDTYRSRLMAKLAIVDLPSLVKFALRHGLTTKR